MRLNIALPNIFAKGKHMNKMRGRSILFLCTGNAIRSQMAEGFARAMLPANWKVYSAGIVAAGLFPQTVAAMKEAGIDISGQRSKTVNDVPVDEIDHVVTLCGDARDNCPLFPGKVEKEHWPIKDPARDIDTPRELGSFRKVRDDIKARVEELAKRLK